MILYIEEDLVAIGNVPTDDEFDDSKLKECAVRFAVKELDNNLIELTLFAQKIFLDEISMNTLFDWYINYFDYTMGYGGYGGEGCEFSISIKKKRKQNENY